MASAPPDHDRRVDYIELPATDIGKTKAFYQKAFGWTFTDYGPGYTSFDDGRLSGGFTTEGKVVKGGTLIVIKAAKLEEVETAVKQAGAKILKPIFSFPGGRRFHFADPNGNELAVWGE